MKKLIVFLNILVLFTTLPSSAFNTKYAAHTSGKDIEFKKKQALKWYTHNFEEKPFPWFDAKKNAEWLKARAFRWYENNITEGKFYFVHSDKELAFTKKKALRWYDKNSD